MTNHVHLLITPEISDGISGMMKKLGQCHVQYINRSYRRSGALWEGRYRSCLVDAQACLFQCMRYIEPNPVRAGMEIHPVDYPWSNYRVSAQDEASAWIRPH